MTTRTIGNGFLRSAPTELKDVQTVPAQFDATALPAASATRRSEIVAVPRDGSVSLLGIELRYVGGASGTTGRAELRVWTSSKDDTPADYTDPSWRALMGTDGVITASQNYAGAAPAVLGGVLMQPLKITTPLAAAAAVMAGTVPVKLPPCRWLYIEACEIGDATHPGTLTIGLTLG